MIGVTLRRLPCVISSRGGGDALSKAGGSLEPRRVIAHDVRSLHPGQVGSPGPAQFVFSFEWSERLVVNPNPNPNSAAWTRQKGRGTCVAMASCRWHTNHSVGVWQGLGLGLGLGLGSF